ncbi:MAG: dipeptidase PepV [Clostridia bacterium]|nr:dipeptidase PepV [Clostridia bacterium]
MLENYIENSKSEMIENLCKLINIPSVYEESNNPRKPFGEQTDKALEYMLNLGQRMGFKTKNIDGYCGYIEFGEGENLIGIIGHLDVVPSGDGWDTFPFEATIKNGNIYGRGSIDDKGPVISALYAMKAIKDNYKINSRVRLILGINEENSWGCINHYKQVEEWPTISFSPDADFPCIYAEKGICTMYLKYDYSKKSDEPIIIADINCNNNAINVVPKFCSCTLQIDTSKIPIDNITNFIDTKISNLGFNISYEVTENAIKIISNGIQAHAAHPNLGANAISRLMVLLNSIFTYFNINIDMLDFFDKHINTEYNGKSLGIDYTDESGNLTLNVGQFKFYEDYLEIGINLRIPVNTPIANIQNTITDICSNYDIKTYVARIQEPLYVSKDSYLVKTLCRIFNEETNSNYEPIAIGGGTYARAFDNCISFGANMPGDTDMCHQANEFIKIDNLILSSKIYAKTILELQNYKKEEGF